jgi:fructosamine-3-kinase
MADINVDELGPVDYVVVGFPADKADFSGAMADQLKKLMESGTVRVLDLLMVTKDEDGTVSVAELRDHDDSLVGELRSLEADLSLMLAVEDVERLGGDLELGSAAAVLVWENTWAAPFASAVRHSGGELLAMGRIPTQALIAAAEEDREAARAEA